MRMQAAEALIRESNPRWSRSRFDFVAEQGGFEGLKVELVRGALVEMAPQGVSHDDQIERISEFFMGKLLGKARVRIQLSLAIDDESELIPDVAILPITARRGVHPLTAHLVVEVSASSGRYDRLVKAPLYAKAEVEEYWVVDVKKHVVEVFSSARNGRYTKHVSLTKGELAVPHFPNVHVTVSTLLKGQ